MWPHINILGSTISVYGLLMVVAGFAAWLVVIVLSKTKKWVPSSDANLAYLVGLCGGIIGAFLLRPIIKIFEVIIRWQRYDFAGIGDFFSYIFGEIVFYGGFIGGLIAIIIFCRKLKIKIVPLFDIFAPALAFAHAIGRLGCLLGGCCFGLEVSPTHPFSIIYPPISLSAPPGIPLLAVPLIEAVFLFALAIVLVIVCLVRKKPGLSASIYLLVYPIGRFILEYFRGDIVRGSFWMFSTSQIISVFVFVFGVVYFIRITRNAKMSAPEQVSIRDDDAV